MQQNYCSFTPKKKKTKKQKQKTKNKTKQNKNKKKQKVAGETVQVEQTKNNVTSLFFFNRDKLYRLMNIMF